MSADLCMKWPDFYTLRADNSVLSLAQSEFSTLNWVVKNYVPQYLRNQVPRTLETMYYVPQARNYVPSTLDTTYFHQKFDNKYGITPTVFKN